MSSCVLQKSLSSEVRSQTSEVTRDTLREQVMVVVLDTVKEVSTVTIRESESGDTLRITTVTDRTRASLRDRYHDVQEKVLIRTDTVYVERESDKQVAVAVGPNTEIAPDGTVTQKINRTAQTLKWVFFVLIALLLTVYSLRFIFKR